MMKRRPFVRCFYPLGVFVAAAVLSSGQVYPGQYPPGQYPQGPYPPLEGTGPGIPIPHRKKKDDGKGSLTVNTGIFFDVEDNGFALQVKDKRILVFQVEKDAKFTSGGKQIALSDLGRGDELEVQSKEDQNNNFFAVNVKLIRKAASAAQTKPAAGGSAAVPPEPPQTVLQREDTSSSDDEDAPRLKRGKPKPNAHDNDLEKEVEHDAKASPSSEPPTAVTGTVASVAAPPAAPAPAFRAADSFLARAREAVAESLEKLPNFICEQYTTRYVSDHRPAEWMPQDVVSAKVIYEDGKESYQNLKINNRSVKDPAKTHNGTWSTGEFGTILADLFDPRTATHFHSGVNTTLNGRDSRVYDFEVAQENSHWKVMPTSQIYFPAYTGSVWFDKTTARALRLESGAVDLPKDFPLDTVESAVDYDFVQIGNHKALLPVKAEILDCERNSVYCTKNVIEFRNYHQFGSETEIKIAP